MYLKNTISSVVLVTVATLAPMAVANANPDAPGMAHCEKMHGGKGMGPMYGPMGMDGMPRDMMQHRRHQMMKQQRHMGQRGPGPMKSRMMQQRMQHMQRMEERMAKIESLLQELVELQKADQPAQ